MLANRVAVIEGGKVIAQDDLHNFLTLDRELYSVAFEPNGDLPVYLTAVERLGGLVKGNIPKAKLYEFMQYTQAANLAVHECSLKKNSLEDSFFKLVKGSSVEA
jgi:ABC-type multidrug transport system ATPase subunit